MNSPEKHPTRSTDWDAHLGHRLKSWVKAHPRPSGRRERLLTAAAGERKTPRTGFLFEILGVFTARRSGELQLGRGLLYTSDLWLFRTLQNPTSMHPGWVLCS